MDQITPNQPIAANDNEVAAVPRPRQLELDLGHPTGPQSPPVPKAKPLVRKKQPAPGPIANPGPLPPVEPDVVSPPDPLPQVEPDVASSREKRDDAVGTVACLTEERIVRDLRMRQLNALMDEAFKLANDRIVMANMASGDIADEDTLVKQWGMAAGCFAKLLTTSHKHRAFLLGGG